MVKKAVVWVLIFSIFLMPTLAMAKVEEGAISDENLVAIFGEDAVTEGSQTVQLATLTDTEMKETEGAWLNWANAGWGALGGGASYVGGWATKAYSWSNWDFAKSIAGGAVGGLFPSSRAWSVAAGSFTGSVISNFKWSNWRR